MKLEDCSLFIEIVRSESLSGAARKLSYSPAAVTARLAAMENELGCRLINRTTRSFQLTEEGQHFLRLANKTCSEFEEFKLGVQEGNGDLKGTIKVTSTYDFGHRYVAPAIKTFIELHKELRIELILTDKVVDIVDSGIDLAIRFGELPDSSLVARKIYIENRRVLVAAPSYLETVPPINTPEDLTNLSCVVNQRAEGNRYQWFFKKIGSRDSNSTIATGSGPQTAISIHPRLLCNDGSQVYRWIKNGAGIGLKSLCDVVHDLKQETLVELLPDYRFEYQSGDSQQSGINLVYPNRRLVPARIKHFMNFLEADIIKRLSVSRQ